MQMDEIDGRRAMASVRAGMEADEVDEVKERTRKHKQMCMLKIQANQNGEHEGQHVKHQSSRPGDRKSQPNIVGHNTLAMRQIKGKNKTINGLLFLNMHILHRTAIKRAVEHAMALKGSSPRLPQQRWGSRTRKINGISGRLLASPNSGA